MAEASICGAATVNAYRRRQPLSFCPVNASWGLDNRTVALRVIEGATAPFASRSAMPAPTATPIF